MSNLVGKKAPVFTLDGVLHKEFKSYSLPHTDGKWTLLLFYPLDFTFVCPTEVIAFSDAVKQFKDLGVELYGVSVDSKFTHLAWTETAREKGGVGDINYPLLADLNKKVATDFGVLLDESVALRGLFLIDPDGVVVQATVNFLNVGRSVTESLRLVKAFQYARKSGDVCPADWEPGKDSMKPTVDGLKAYGLKHAS